MDNSQSHGAHTFPPTMWSMVRLAFAEKQPGADQALNQLCQLYEKPILGYIIRDGQAPQDAHDLKQGFFANLLATSPFADAEAEATRVKLRAFLLTKLQSYLIDQYRRSVAQKRGAGKVVALGDLSEEQQHLAEPVDNVTPDIAYQRQWLATVFSTAMQQLRADYAERYLKTTSGNEEAIYFKVELKQRPANPDAMKSPAKYFATISPILRSI